MLHYKKITLPCPKRPKEFWWGGPFHFIYSKCSWCNPDTTTVAVIDSCRLRYYSYSSFPAFLSLYKETLTNNKP